MIYLLQSWKDSLRIFLPVNFKLFFLVTLKTIIQVYKKLFTHFWWLLVVTAISDYAYARYAPQAFWYGLGLLFLWLMLLFCMYLVIRPSIKKKGFEYYIQYGKHFIYFLFFSLFIFIIPNIYIAFANRIAFLVAHLSRALYILMLPFLLFPIFITFFITLDFLFTYVSPLLTFTILFLLDSDGSFKNAFRSLKRACKMVCYNYPFCFIFFAFFFLITLGLYKVSAVLFGTQMYALSPVLAMLLLPIPLCILNNFYVKRLHDQFTLYFPETVKEQS